MPVYKMAFLFEDIELRFILIFVAFIIDLVVGDPVYPLHPVRLIGYLIMKLEKMLFRLNLRGYFGGSVLWFFVVFLPISMYLSLAFIFKIKMSNVLFIAFLDLFIYYSLFSAKDLIKHVADVCNALELKGLEGGRRAVSLIVGRSTDELSQSEISKATVETLAENSSDGIVAPLFFALLLGPIGLLLYKSVNTLDSMVGYRSEKYLKFGFFSAKTDDLLNWIPARITSLIILLPHLFSLRVLSTFWKYRRSHLSPNAGYPESAMAAILNVKMGGPAMYHGRLIEKDYINPNGDDMDIKDIKKAIKIIWHRSVIILLSLALLIFISQIETWI